MTVSVVQLTRYPVKSLQGEDLSHAEIEADGLSGDRGWGILDEGTGRILTARRAPQLLFGAATLDADGEPVITLPTGTTCRGVGTDTDSALTEWLGKPVRLVRSVDVPPAQAEFFADATDDSSEALQWTMPEGRFVDAAALLVLTTASLRAGAAEYPDGDWRSNRFRPNLVLDVADDGWVEDAWCGQATLRIGNVELRPDQPCIRCTMVTRPQPGIDEDRDIFRALARSHSGHFGAWTAVAAGGNVSVGDAVTVS